MANPQQVGSFVPTTLIIDPSELRSVDLNSDRFREILVLLYLGTNRMIIPLNEKDWGKYAMSELVNGQTWFPNPSLNSASQLTPTDRQVFRKVINFGGLPNAGTTSIPHGISITSAVTFTRIYATASDTAGKSYIPIPYVDAAGTNIGIEVDATNVNITTVDDRTNYTVCYVVLEYLKF